MNIGMQAWGSAGDLRPMLALGGALAARGHRVTLSVAAVDGRDYASLAAGLGVELRALAPLFSTREEMTCVAPLIAGRISQERQYTALFDRLLFPFESELWRAALAQARDSDVIVTHPLAYPAGAAAEKYGRPLVTHNLSDMGVPSGAYPPANLAPVLNFFNSAAVNRLAWRVSDWAAGQLFLRRMNSFRAQVGVPALTSFFGQGVNSPYLNLLSASPFLCPPRADWAAHTEVCGYFTVPLDRTDLTRHKAVADFIAAGAPPVLMGFGSMSDFDAHLPALENIFAQAAALAGARAIIQIPGRETEIRGDCLFTGLIEHRAVAPCCAAMVHHGGAGSTHTALLCGVPQIIVAHIADQPYWGRLIYQKGLGPRHFTRPALTAQRLAASIKRVLSDPGYKTRAGQAAKDVAGDGGAPLAAELIERTYGNG